MISSSSVGWNLKPGGRSVLYVPIIVVLVEEEEVSGE